ncbi:flagellar hook-associated protein 3 [Acidaminobacter sp. JC074]|uniref:flagellar hook-associated protein FlgL n=1 Tax=Acidaminobacter sp. JC074 TaxID=2530199 RepID=UPI001F0F03A1|nr:flagellar hook-associated protein FlgL [Acidaminobacter sp. JC074]MCH4889299.1 flagellar hook-associated protein 3 [Acidaminobacter sp. JC074]
MRVTNNMMTSNLLYNVNKNLEYMSERQDELATGKKIQRPSDDPVLSSKILSRRTDLAELEQYDKNTRDALGWLEVTEKALEDNGDIFQRIRELTVQAANGTNTAGDTQKIKLEIEQMKEQLITNGNTTFAGRYVFSGFETDKKLLNKDGSYNLDLDAYTINEKPVVKYEVQVGESMNVMTSGLDVYGTVDEVNILDSIMPVDGTDPTKAATDEGVAATKSYMQGSFDMSGTYGPGSLSMTINGTAVVIPPTAPAPGVTLDGSVAPLNKELVLDTINGELGTNGTAYFNANDQLVIESAGYGAANSITGFTAPAGYTLAAPGVVAGVGKVEATVSGPAYPVQPPAPNFTAAEQDLLRDNPMMVVVDGVSKKLSPLPTDTLDTLQDYATAINNRAIAEFGADVVTISVNGANELTVTTASPAPDTEIHKQPTLTVDFPRTRTSEMMADLDELIAALDTGDQATIDASLGKIDGHMNRMLSLRADIGARVNRMEMIAKKISANNVSFTSLLSDAQDADMSEVIMKLKNAENVYKASLNTGARVIQPSLIDFIR